ncbi:MAG: PhoX family protein, partial [Chitinophagales bacterium]|nr:PhoX family protein [Chitinophagales bacterium]
MKTINVLRSSILFYILFLIACQSDNKRDKIQTWFEQIAPDFSTQTLRVPQGYTYDILFSEGDTVLTLDGKRTPAKGKHDFVAYIPIAGSSEHGYLYVGHESHDTNSILGDGGAGTVFEVKKIDGNWRAVSDFYAIDFRAVGGSLRNCGGTLTPAGTIFSAEECEPKSNADLFIQHSFRDTADI